MKKINDNFQIVPSLRHLKKEGHAITITTYVKVQFSFAKVFRLKHFMLGV